MDKCTQALGLRLALGLSLVMACSPALAQVMYRIKPLGVLGGCTAQPPVANGFNKNDQVTGKACNAHGDQHAFLWKNDGTAMVDLGPREVGSTSEGNAINASGQVAGSGYDSTGYFAFMSSGGKALQKLQRFGTEGFAFAINDSGQVAGGSGFAGQYLTHTVVWKNNGQVMIDLGVLYDYDYNYGLAINASGQVAGISGYSSEPYAEATLWQNDGSPLFSLGLLFNGSSSSACCINASGQVAGNSDTQAHSHVHAFIWKNDGTPIQSLGTLGGAESVAYALNDAGQIAGWSDTVRFLKPHAFVWLNNGKPMKNLGTLGGTSSQANDINASGQVAGWASLAGDSVVHAFLWRNDGGKIQDLNTLIDPTDPLQPYVTLTNAAFINAAGDILAEGTDSRTGNQGLYVLPGTVLTLSPRALAFGNQPVNTASAAKSVTVTNTSSKAAAITQIALSGTGAGQFASTNDCGKSLGAHGACTIKVTFKPTSKGAKSAILNVNGGGGGLRSVNLSGTGT
jgi:probable HAF family extracellular repeat protein